MKAAPPQDARSAIDSIAFPDAAKIGVHAFAFEECCSGSFIDLQIAIVNKRQAPAHHLPVGNRVVLVLIVEFPEARQHPERDIEFPAGPVADLARGFQNIPDFAADLNGVVARGGIQAVDVAPFAPRGHQVIEPLHFRKNSFEGRRSRRFI